MLRAVGALCLCFALRADALRFNLGGLEERCVGESVPAKSLLAGVSWQHLDREPSNANHCKGVITVPFVDAAHYASD